MNPALYIDPENRLSRVPYKVPNNTHYVTLAQYQLMELQLKAEVERLRASSFVTAVPVEEYEKLKAEVERLTERNKFLEQIDSYLQGANENAYEKRCDELEAEVDNSNRINTELLLLSNKQASEVRRLTAELSNISGWGRGLESDLSHARVEISFLKAEVERLTEDNRQLKKAFEIAEGIIKRMGNAAENAAKEGKQP